MSNSQIGKLNLTHVLMHIQPYICKRDDSFFKTIRSQVCKILHFGYILGNSHFCHSVLIWLHICDVHFIKVIN